MIFKYECFHLNNLNLKDHIKHHRSMYSVYSPTSYETPL